nr:proline-rich receptor-like protein kinase PERK2 [Aegilops tauschii subsp. strangulata]
MRALCLSGPTPLSHPAPPTQPRPCPNRRRRAPPPPGRCRHPTPPQHHPAAPEPCGPVATTARRPLRPASAAPPLPPPLPPPHPAAAPPRHPEPCGPVATTARCPVRPASATPPPRSPMDPSPPPPGAPSVWPAPLRRRATPLPGAPGPAAGVDRMMGKGPERPEPPASATGGVVSLLQRSPSGERCRTSDDELVEKGKKVYKRGYTKLPPVQASPDKRWLIAPKGLK